ncbi:hypothetical protein [Aestuariibaculum marinum]|uniref:Glycosyl hydrolase family 43 n=1 Tax=Aestuariibaculum marinum TaxID=2683592 RepID=A0A8J6PPW0_9FLAO|nr:hypothetical protein [Aestuariibaculum marinum]MBD0822845.1 hypothetical protein [Aestuariibaculum marinum]
MKNCPIKKLMYIILGLCVVSTIGAQSSWKPDDSKGFVAHDPVMIKQDSIYYLFTTGGGMTKSKDLKTWDRLKPVPSKLEWVTDDIIQGYRGGYLVLPIIE